MTGTDAARLAGIGLAAYRARDFAAAKGALEQIVRTGRADIAVLILLARVYGQLGLTAPASGAVTRALQADRRHPEALVLRGEEILAAGDERAATSFFRAALQAAPPASAQSPEMRADLARAQHALDAAAKRFEAHLRAGLAGAGFDPARSSARFAESVDIVSGAKRIYLQQPRFYFFPGLPHVGFHPREATPFLAEVEAHTDAIRAEALAIMADEAAFTPYVEDRANRPHNAQAGMLGNPDWSAFFLWKDGAEVAAHAARCPATMKALAGLPLGHIDGRAPSILFSRLAPGAHIPPHNGLINTRLICHLPLIVPEGCRLRVGNETRAWEEGKAWAFDDTIEHEAWNTSDRTRVILIFDVWKSEITHEERGLLRALFRTIDSYGPKQVFDDR